MRNRQYLCIILLVLAIIFNEKNKVLAMDTGFSTVPLDAATIGTVLENICIVPLSDEPSKAAIKCFAVDEDGSVAIGSNNSENRIVCVYSSKGEFQYGFRFKCSGSFGVGLSQNTLSIYLVRSDIAISISPEGKVNEILKIEDTLENNDYWNNHVFSNKKVVSDAEYILENSAGVFDVFASSYSQLIVTDESGITSIIYDSNEAQLSHIIIIGGFILVFTCIAVIVFYYRYSGQGGRTAEP